MGMVTVHLGVRALFTLVNSGSEEGKAIGRLLFLHYTSTQEILRSIANLSGAHVEEVFQALLECHKFRVLF